MFQRKTIIDVTPTPDELAAEFAEMDGEQQAMFFNELARLVRKWDRPFAWQLQAITDTHVLTSEGRSIIKEIGEYAHKIYAKTGL